jgi:DNA-binding CsgD family transcriptional regulator
MASDMTEDVADPPAQSRDTDRARPTFGWESLTHRERSVAALVADGMTNRQAAERRATPTPFAI